ncbi:LacI family transcriptional regulator [Paenibacillus sp. TRM 82003]|uniref:LacI family DNA-binding transcriptional regulator n=1 Tax=Kineococcus sp. TRM81007 TaxID=2925831 RepID=UPI001F581E45|nr:LacI family DNA-binding transcriptional regulator [Kineococcus sp. TRM81007]MCI2238935.1 LacI family transcriptional regulator [Kineococcus sp. TRM81007]MCI3924354.1 LacI family transcriptional regulator [Paenibacillus sp. TRM 82003]
MATIADVAEVAGVSASTVSYVLSGKRAISAATRARVEEAVSRLGYRPHAGARALASSRTGVLALVVPLHDDVDVGVVMQFVRGVVTTARAHDHDILLLTQEETAGLERVTSTSLVDGLVVLDIGVDDPRVGVLARLGRPTVLVGVPRDPHGLSCVDFDFAGAARVAVAHLAALGHRRVGLVGATPSSVRRGAGYADRLREGFLAGAAAAGLTTAAAPCAATAEGARACLAELRAQLPAPTALVVHNEAALPHLLAALDAEGTRVPDDLSIVSVGAPDARARALTGLDVPALDIGRASVEVLLERTAAPRAPEVRLLSSLLTDRGSTAAPR